MKAINVLMGIVGTAAWYEQSVWLAVLCVLLTVFDTAQWSKAEKLRKGYRS